VSGRIYAIFGGVERDRNSLMTAISLPP
jgi:hypothetical protein